MRNRLLLAILFLFITTKAFAVCDATLTVCPGGGCDYTGLNAAVTYLEIECSSPSEPLTIEISGDWTSTTDTTLVGISGITTTSSNTLTIFTSGDARHNGTLSATRYKLEAGGFGAQAFTGSINYLIVDGITIKSSVAGNTRGTNISGDSCIVKNNIFYYHSGNLAQVQIVGGSSAGTSIKFYNNIIYGNTITNSTSLALNNYQGQYCDVYNNTILFTTAVNGMNPGDNNTRGIIKNNLSIGHTTDFAPFRSMTHSNNASADLTGDITGYTASNLFVNIGSSTEDLHLKSGADAIDAGADLGTDYDTDIDGDSRPQGSAWDIGADEYVSGVTLTVIRNAILRNAIIR